MIIGAAMQSKRIRSFSEEGLAIVDGIVPGTPWHNSRDLRYENM
jgi:hypothetical protein